MSVDLSILKCSSNPIIDDSNNDWLTPQFTNNYDYIWAHTLKYKNRQKYDKYWEKVECGWICFFCIGGGKFGRPVQEVYDLYQIGCRYQETEKKESFVMDVSQNWEYGCDGFGNPPFGCTTKKALK